MITGNLRGIVITVERRPVSEAIVMLTSGPKHHDIAALTADDGSFEMIGLEPGIYRVLARSSDGQMAQKLARVESGTTTTMELVVGI
jgi:hypothetical protein